MNAPPDAIALPGGHSLGRDQLGPCRCPGCRGCGSGCSGTAFEARVWRYRADAASEWSEGFAVRCRRCLPPAGARKNAAGDLVKTEDETVATVDMATGAVVVAGASGKREAVHA